MWYRKLFTPRKKACLNVQKRLIYGPNNYILGVGEAAGLRLNCIIEGRARLLCLGWGYAPVKVASIF